MVCRDFILPEFCKPCPSILGNLFYLAPFRKVRIWQFPGQGFTESFEGVFILLETLRFTFQICKKQGLNDVATVFRNFSKKLAANR